MCIQAPYLRPNDYALVVGINDYLLVKDGGLPTLVGAIPDAKAVAAWLIDSQGGGMPMENCHTLYSTADPRTPLQDAIDNKLEQIFTAVLEKGGRADRFYFYFSGHGFGSENSYNDIAMCIANWSLMRRRSAISSSEYFDLFVKYKVFSEVVFWSDCCRNTSHLIRPIGPTLDVFNYGNEDTVYMIAYSTQYMDQAFEVNSNTAEEKRGLFSELLVRGLKGEASNRYGAINSHSLKIYLDIHVPAAAQRQGFKQKPQISTTANENSIIFKQVLEPQIIQCIISVSKENIGNLEVHNGNLDLIFSVDIQTPNDFQIDLNKGLYLIKNPKKGSQKFFNVIARGGTQHVRF